MELHGTPSGTKPPQPSPCGATGATCGDLKLLGATWGATLYLGATAWVGGLWRFLRAGVGKILSFRPTRGLKVDPEPLENDLASKAVQVFQEEDPTKWAG